MEIADLAAQPQAMLEEAARLLVDGFDPPYGWPALPPAREALHEVLRDGFARALLDDNTLLGWIGGLPEYDGRVWELHPLVVRRDCRRRGIGRTLVEAFEAEVRARGALTITLGTDDCSGMTSLGGTDLYADVAGHLRDVHDLGRSHPFLFYRKLGYAVTGVLPDANGVGKPDIFMSKRA
jgi:aminoglycoside 6'-N-acetyltransferase I